MGLMYLRRRVSFAAAHAYWRTDWTEAENREVFGQWASRWGHGHNYVVEATVAGEIDPASGMVVNITEVDRVLKQHVTGPLADKHLNYDVPHFAATPPTLENIARYIADQFEQYFTNPNARLVRVTVWEMPTLWVTLNVPKTQENNTMIGLTRSFDFAAAHRLHAPGLSDADNATIFGKCDNPNGHGHNYGVEVTVTGDPDPRTGMLVDLAALDAILEREVMDRFDHKHLNLDVADFRDSNPTSENVTKVIWDHLAGPIGALPSGGTSRVKLYRVVVRETERNYFEYYGENAPPLGFH